MSASPLWRKAPFVLAQYPGLFVSLAFGTLLLAIAAAVYPLFLSGTTSRLLRSEISNPIVTPFGAGITYRNTVPIPEPGQTGSARQRIDAAFRDVVAMPELEPVQASVLGPVVEVARADRPAETRDVRLFAGTGAAAASTVVSTAESGADRDGAWVPDDVARVLGIQPGDTILVRSQGGRQVSLPVAGIFVSPYKQRLNLPAYWSTWNDALVLYCGDCAPPPQPLIVPADRLSQIAATLRIDHAASAWVAPAPQDLTLEGARAVAARSSALGTLVHRSTGDTGRLLGTCFVKFFGFCPPRLGPGVTSQMSPVISKVDRRVTTIEGPGRLLRAAGFLVALVVVAAAGAFSMEARRVEASLLYARGVGPLAVAVRSATESVLPCALGGLAGLVLSLAAMKVLDPGGAIEAGARIAAIRGAAVAVLVAIGLIGLVSAVSFLRHSEHHRSRARSLAGVPWEIAICVASLWIYERLRSGGAFVTDPVTDVRSPSVLLLVFPVLFLAGFATLLARAAGFAFQRWRDRSRRQGSSAFLAAHRLAGAPNLTLLLIGASGLCLGLFVQSQVLVRSLRSTVDAKAEVYVGSDVQARISFSNTDPEAFPLPITRVTRRLQAGAMSPGARDYDLLAIDPDTFADAAYWNGAFASEPLSSLLGRLREDSSSSLPILIAGADTGPDPSSISLDELDLPVRVVGRTTSFPGVSSYRPLVVVSQRALLNATADAPNPLDEVGAQTELWSRGDPSRARAALADALPYQPGLVITANEVRDIPYISATIGTFEAMNGLGLAAALLVLVAMVMYLQARQRSQVVEYGLSLRMGMRPGEHLAALFAELAAMATVAGVAAVILAYIAARLLLPLLDPLPEISPAPFLLVPRAAIGITAPLLAAVVAAGALLTDRRARRADLGQVMRLAD